MTGARTIWMPVIDVPSVTDLDAWVASQALPDEAERPIWKPSSVAGRRFDIRGLEHLAVLMRGLLGLGDGFAVIEWPRPFPQLWAQTRPSGGGLLVELNDGVVQAGREYPCTRRAFRGSPGEYPLGDESDPRRKTSLYPTLPIERFSPLEGAELIWPWITTAVLAPGISVTMRHFGVKERQHYGCGDL